MEANHLICRDLQILSADPSQAAHPASAGVAQCPRPLPEPDAPPKKKEHGPLFWGISGGTVLSVVGFIAMIGYQQYSDSLNELRSNLRQFHITCGDLVKREDMQSRLSIVFNRVKELSDSSTDRKMRLTVLEHSLKASEDERRELVREVQLLRERLAAVEGRLAPTRAHPTMRTGE